jgi:lipopolysaccharide transport system ATP-binding protein
MSAHEVLISLKNVSISYNVSAGFLRWEKYTPLRNISFDVHSGETVGVVGRNGAGKSTLLRLIAGIVEPDKGQVLNRGVRVSLLSLGVGFISHLTGRQNAILSGMLLGLRMKDVKQKLDAIIEFSGLEKFIDQPLHTYSTGMRARLGFSVAIQINPDVLLIDEVLGVGDEEFRGKSNAEIRRLFNADKTVIIVSHNLQTLKDLCEKLIWIEDGVIVENGPVDVVSNHYAHAKNKHAAISR